MSDLVSVKLNGTVYQFNDLDDPAVFEEDAIQEDSAKAGINLPAFAWKYLGNKEAWRSVLYANPHYLYSLDMEQTDGILFNRPKKSAV